MHEYSNPAVVLGGDVTGLGAARSLGRVGVTVYYFDEEAAIARYSRYCKKYFLLPRISRHKNELREALLKLQHHSNDGPVIFPASDSYALVVSDLIDELKGCHVPIARREITEVLIDKRRFYKSLIKGNVPHPTTHFPQDLEDVKAISRTISYPALVRPSSSQLFATLFHKKGFVANSREELLRDFALLSKTGVDGLIQEIVKGPPTNHIFLDGYLDKESKPKALFVRRRLRMWPLLLGNSSLCISICASEVYSLKEMLFKYLRSIGWHGIFSAEFKMDQMNGLFKLLEINARTSAWFNTLSAKCGLNLMFLAYLDAVGKNVPYSEEYEAGTRWVCLRDDLRSSILMLKDGDLSIQGWVSSLQGKVDHLYYAKDDLRPLVMSLAHMVSGKPIGNPLRRIRSTG